MSKTNIFSLVRRQKGGHPLSFISSDITLGRSISTFHFIIVALKVNDGDSLHAMPQYIHRQRDRTEAII